MDRVIEAFVVVALLVVLGWWFFVTIKDSRACEERGGAWLTREAACVPGVPKR